MKNPLSVLFMIGITLSFFSACANPKIPSLEEDDDMLDFREKNIVVAVDEHFGKYPHQRGKTASTDRELDRFDATEKEFNFKFDFLQNVDAGIMFLSAALSGGMQADLLFSSSGDAFNAYIIDTLLPAENFISDPTAEKWKPASEMLGIWTYTTSCSNLSPGQRQRMTE